MFLQNPIIDDKIKQILSSIKVHQKNPNNIFRIISDVYHKENFHSDVLFSILGCDALSAFNFVKALHDTNHVSIEGYDSYKKTKILREKDRIDLLIINEDETRCIIIENKINEAGDMPNQLARYYEIAINKKLNVDAIIYLSIDGKKIPNSDTFGSKNNKIVKELTYILPASNFKENDLVNSWLKPLCDYYSKSDIELHTIIKHYIDILNELGEHTMNASSEQDFLNWLLKENNLKNSIEFEKLFLNRISIALESFRIYIQSKIEQLKSNFLSIPTRVSGVNEPQFTFDWTTTDGKVRFEFYGLSGSEEIIFGAYVPDKSNSTLLKNKWDTLCEETSSTGNVDGKLYLSRKLNWHSENTKIFDLIDGLFAITEK